MSKFTIIRGLPGSGKSTLARKMIYEFPDYTTRHFEADMYFKSALGYQFDASKLHQAHKWCFDSVKESLTIGCDCIVSNTFTTLKEIKPYIVLAEKLGIPYEVIRCTSSFGSLHNVPEATLAKMAKRFQDYKGEILV
jgi:adenylate kinase family enzyme